MQCMVSDASRISLGWIVQYCIYAHWNSYSEWKYLRNAIRIIGTCCEMKVTIASQTIMVYLSNLDQCILCVSS